MPKMTVLPILEANEFDRPPNFSPAQRRVHFEFPQSVLAEAARIHTDVNRIYFLVLCAYLGAANRFYPPESFRDKDIDQLCRLHGAEAGLDVSTVSFERRSHYRNRALELYGLKACDANRQQQIRSEIDQMVLAEANPRRVFKRTVEWLLKQRIEIPSYRTLSKLIAESFDDRRHTLGAAIDKNLDAATRATLEQLLTKPAGPEPGRTAVYRITLLKKLSQSARPAKVKSRVADLKTLHDLHGRIKPHLAGAGMNADTIRYYANSVIRAQVFQVERRADPDRLLHLVAFIAHQYRQLQDNLVDVMLAAVQSSVRSAQREHKELVYDQRVKDAQSLKQSFRKISTEVLGFVDEVERIVTSGDNTDKQRIAELRALLRSKKQKRVEAAHALKALKEALTDRFDATSYVDTLEKRSRRLQLRVGPILRGLSIQAEPTAMPLMRAVEHWKRGGSDSAAPLDFLDDSQRVAVTRDNRIHAPLYKVFLFVHVVSAIKAGTFNLLESYKYRALDDYLISQDAWSSQRDALLDRSGLEAFANFNKCIDQLKAKLQKRYESTNESLTAGNNCNVVRLSDQSLRVNTPSSEQTSTGLLSDYFPKRRYVSLLEVLATVDRLSKFSSELQHWQHRHHKGRPPAKTFLAGIIALGCQIGTRKIARISHQINEAQLENTVNWYFTVENMRAANDRILRLVDRLELPEIYRRQPGMTHTSSDGQKFEVYGESLNASRSFKYFGKHQGSSVYSFVDERHMLFYSTVISAAERESAYVIDGLMYNDVVKSNIHSTDTHGYSEIVFGVMHLLGISYAPRIKNLKKQRIYGFKGSPNSAEWWMRPSGHINVALLEAEWDNILRFVATIRLGHSTASELFRRLNSYSRQHSLYRALKAFGQVIKSIFILQYIDELELRQAVQRQLNKVESSNRFTRAILVGSPREILQTHQDDQVVAESCTRLIKNAITCWNYVYLAQRMANAEPETQEAISDAIGSGSVVSWQHINLLGEYDFSEEKMADTVGIKPPVLKDA